ncbi:hypothetical protein SAMN04488503_2234 [Humidesulfovibrio mexicanus]|uniref:Uncharacterized protein n=1 Tax=Humidesulfovibrio mexicanus TaxID=147047 RepID=A0A239AUV2_9BACT|nr:hypothetical protein [Humidesulfovibrio mexicanus]SNR99350.1 hypothetical protein SAMN04488503_2234 [Humidesulfovibrio mexicanus]
MAYLQDRAHTGMKQGIGRGASNYGGIGRSTKSGKVPKYLMNTRDHGSDS